MHSQWLVLSLKGAVASNDGGHVSDAAKDWVLKSPRNLDWATVTNFGSVALSDLTITGKSIASEYSGRASDYSYFYGVFDGTQAGADAGSARPRLVWWNLGRCARHQLHTQDLLAGSHISYSIWPG